jgi:hypothetical protein
MVEKATLVIPFSPDSADQTLQLVLDEDKHPQTPASTDDIYVRALTDQVLSSIGTTGGSVKIENASLQFDCEQTLAFYDSQEGSLQYPCSSVLSTSWVGNSLGAVAVNGKNVRVGQKGYGLLKVKYRVAYVLLKVTGTTNLEGIIVWAHDSAGKEGYLLVQFRDMASEEYEPVIVEVRDYCSDLPVSGASVKVAGVTKGTTDQWGQVQGGKHKRGEIVTLEVSKQGFKNSKDDALANDSFQVI